LRDVITVPAKYIIEITAVSGTSTKRRCEYVFNQKLFTPGG